MYHKVTIIGNLGGDPEMRYTPNGTAVTNFNVATSEKVSKEKVAVCPEGWKESYNGKGWTLTTWWRVTVWRKMAEVCNQFLSKGAQVYLEGEMSGDKVNGVKNPRVWTGNDGIPRASFEITARTVKFIGGRSQGESSSGEGLQEPPPGFVEDESIPF